MADLARLAIHEGSTPHLSFREAVEAYARNGITAMTVRRDKVASHGVEAAARLLRDAGLKVVGLSGTGSLTAADPDEHARQVADNRIALDMLAAVGGSVAVFNLGPIPRGLKDAAGARACALDGLAELLPHARALGVSLGIEPLHPTLLGERNCLPTIALANDFCDALGEGAGVVVDSFHVWWDPALAEGIARAGKAKRLRAFHLSDWLVPTRDALNDRGMMGDGIVDFRQMRGWMDEAGYDGFLEVEIFSRDNWWKRDPDEFLTICKERFISEV